MRFRTWQAKEMEDIYYDWRIGFAWYPKNLGGEWVWLSFYKWRYVGRTEQYARALRENDYNSFYPVCMYRCTDGIWVKRWTLFGDVEFMRLDIERLARGGPPPGCRSARTESE